MTQVSGRDPQALEAVSLIPSPAVEVMTSAAVGESRSPAVTEAASRPGKRPRARRSDMAFGPVCACGGTKAKQAWTCQPCHGRLRGYGLVPRDEQNRRAGRKYRGYTVVVGDEDAALVARADRLSAARAELYDRELAALVAEQARDERFATFAQDRWMVSLDDVDLYGRPLYEVIAA